MFTGKAITQGLKALDAQLKQTGTITSRLTPEQRAGLLKMFGKWKNKSFKLLPSAYSYTIDSVQGRLDTVLDEARKFIQDENLADETVECHITYGHSLRVAGCVPMADAALAVKYTKRFQRLQKKKQARKNRAKAARQQAKHAKVLSQANALKDVAALLKQLKLLKADAKVTKKAAKSVKKTKKVVKPVVKTTFPFESNGRG
jgi:hypothetical protein